MKRKESYILGVRVSALVEIALFFVFMFVLSFIIGANFNYFKVSPHPFWIVVILISTQYGTLEGLIAAAVSSIILLIGPLPERNILQEHSEYFYILAKNPMLWFMAALIVGEIRMRHIRERDKLRVLAYETQVREKNLAESYEGLKRIKERLEVRIASETQTTLMVVDALNKLRTAGKVGIVPATSDLIKIMVSPEKFSIYLLSGNELKQSHADGWTSADKYAVSFGPTSELYKQIVEKKKTVTLTTSDPKILGSEGVLAAPILEPGTNKVLGMIKVEQIPFQRLKLAAVESLSMIGKWIGQSYAN